MPLTNFPQGVSSFGMPQLGAADVFTTGNVYFVSSTATNSSDGNLGDSPGVPLATINAAFDKVTANNGDIVFIMPGHNEDVDSATDVVLDVAGVRVIGIGSGAAKPKLTFTGTAGSIEMDAASCSLENVRFLASVSAVVVGVNVDAQYCTLKDCLWDFDETGDDFLIMVDVDAQDDCQILGCTFRAEAAAGSNEAIRIDAADNLVIDGCHISGDYAVGAIINGSGDAVCLNIAITNNFIFNQDAAAAQNGIDLDTACTGLISNNRIAGLQATGVANLLDPGSCLCTENYGVNAIDETGIVVPTTAST